MLKLRQNIQKGHSKYNMHITDDSLQAIPSGDETARRGTGSGFKYTGTRQCKFSQDKQCHQKNSKNHKEGRNSSVHKTRFKHMHIGVIDFNALMLGQ
jgi:hypothetical protein